VDSVAEAEAALADAEALEKCVTAAMMGAELPGRCDAYAPPEPGWGDEVAKATEGLGTLALGAGVLLLGGALFLGR
jgi:hypothetical protein